MLATRIIPTILKKGKRTIKDIAYAQNRVVGSALQSALVYANRNIDELVILDITATKENTSPDYEMIKKLSQKVFAPITIGGGVKKAEHVRELLNAGADKVLVCSEQFWNKDLVRELSSKFGSSTIVAGIEVKDGKVTGECGTRAWNYDPVEWAKALADQGAGEIMLSCVERDGSMRGYDIALIQAVCDAVHVPVIASGGCSGYEDMCKAVYAGASGVAAGALFQFQNCTPAGAAEYMKDQGIEVRI